MRIPAGVADGQRIRVKARGGAGNNGGPAGDLYVIVHVGAHALFGRNGNDLTLRVPVTFAEATLGANVKVPTLDGQVTVRVPPGTPSGKVMRVRGKGIPSGNGKGTGDLLVTRRRAGADRAQRRAARGGREPHRRSLDDYPRAGAVRGTRSRRSPMDADGRALYVISVAAELAGMHPQTLRIYERKGLIEPARTSGRSRRYSERDIELLRRIQELSSEGVSLAGVQRILALEEELAGAASPHRRAGSARRRDARGDGTSASRAFAPGVPARARAAALRNRRSFRSRPHGRPVTVDEKVN